MKIAERAFDDDGKLIIKQTHDVNPLLDSIKRDKNAGLINGPGDGRRVARIPGWLITEWLKEAGKTWDDPEADEVIKKKIMGGEFNALRLWEGRF